MSAPANSSEEVGFVLVHGAGFDVWIWEELVSRMQAPTLSAAFPARKADQSARDDLRLADYTEAVTEQVEEWEMSHVILVGHSIGGAVCMEVASRLANRLTGFVGLSAGTVVSVLFPIPPARCPTGHTTVRRNSAAGANYPWITLCRVN
jgi:pimeloyl-ACP methyl ester carboxylesterase